MKRVGIYFFYDKDGVVDDYVGFFLEAINQHLEKLVVVVNGHLTVQSHQYLEAYSDDVIVRENKGFDVWAYKTAIEYIGWDELAEYDELLLMSYAQFGPIHPFSEMFDVMEARTELDFWGITKYHKQEGVLSSRSFDLLNEYLQSDFLALRKTVFMSYEYRQFWKDMSMITSYADSVSYYESIFTKTFNDYGFSSDSYIDTSDLIAITDDPLLLMPDELIDNRRCPVIKIRSFFHTPYDYIVSSVMPNKTRRALEFIGSATDYDTGLVWENILRVCNMRDILQMLELNYVLPTHESRSIEKYNIAKKINIGLVAHIYFEDQVSYSLGYIKNVTHLSADVLITTPSEKMKEKVIAQLQVNGIQADVIVIENRGRDVSALLVGAKDFVLSHDLICFVHDKKTTQVKPGSIGQAFAEYCFKNTLASRDYVDNILNLFKEESRLGLLSPPFPLVGGYIDALHDPWMANFECTQDFLKENGFKVPIHRDKASVAPYGTMFWFRTEALRKLFELNFSYDSFPKEPNNYDGTILHAIERAYPLVAQSSGFYSANVVSDDTARTQLTTFQYRHAEIQKKLRASINISDSVTYRVYQKIVSILPGFVKKPLKYMVIKLVSFKNKFKNH